MAENQTGLLAFPQSLHRTPTSLTPDVFELPRHHVSREPITTDATLNEVRSALQAGGAAAEAARKACAAIHQDGTLTEVAKHVNAKKAAVAVTKGALAAFDRATEKLNHVLAELEIQVAAPKPPAGYIGSTRCA